MNKPFFFWLLSAALLLSPSILWAQSILGENPYGNVRLGELNPQSNSRGMAMGGVGVASYSPNVANTVNPALLHKNYRTNLEVGLFGIRRTLNDGQDSKVSGGGGISHLRYVFPIKQQRKFEESQRHLGTIAVGVSPFTSKGFNQRFATKVGGENFEVQRRGEGGTYKASFQAGSELFKGFYAGASGHLVLGTVQTEELLFLPEPPNSNSLVNATVVRDLTQEQVRGFLYDVGFGYEFDFGGFGTDSTGKPKAKKYQMMLGASLEGPSALNIGSERTFGRYYQATNLISPAYVDATDTLRFLGPEQISAADQSAEAALGYRFGVAITKPYNRGKNVYWQLSLEGGYRDFSGFNPDNQTTNLAYGERAYLAMGFELLPFYDLEQGYMNLISYRLGANFEQTEFTYNNNPINRAGINFGLGLPLSGLKSTDLDGTMPYLNLFAQYSQLDRPEATAVSIGQWYFGAGLVLNDARWFFKRKYD